MPVKSCVSSFTSSAFSRINLAFNHAYSVVNDLATHAPFMLAPPFRSQFQTLYNACAEHAVHDMVSNGRFPNHVTADYVKNEAKNFSYIRLTAEGCTLTFSSCNNQAPARLPRPSIFRQEQSYRNQCSLLYELPLDSEETSYGIVVHRKVGANGAAYPKLALGIPDNDYTHWIGYENFATILANTPTLEADRQENEYLDHLKGEISKKATEDIKKVAEDIGITLR